MGKEIPPTVYLLTGLTGSGKTTYARALEDRGVLRLSVDEEIFARHGRYGVDYPEDNYRTLEAPVVAQSIQLSIEYDPQPPYDAGSPEKAPAKIVDAQRARSRFILADRA